MSFCLLAIAKFSFLNSFSWQKTNNWSKQFNDRFDRNLPWMQKWRIKQILSRDHWLTDSVIKYTFYIWHWIQKGDGGGGTFAIKVTLVWQTVWTDGQMVSKNILPFTAMRICPAIQACPISDWKFCKISNKPLFLSNN